MKLDVLLFSTRSPALYVGRVQELGLGAADEDVAELHVIGRVLGEEVVPAILVVVRAALIRIRARVTDVPGAPIETEIRHRASNVGVRRAKQRRHLLVSCALGIKRCCVAVEPEGTLQWFEAEVKEAGLGRDGYTLFYPVDEKTFNRQTLNGEGRIVYTLVE